MDEVLASFPLNERNDCKQVFDSVLSDGHLVMLAPQLCWHKDTYDRVCEVARTHFEANETLTLAQLRDLLGTSRKYALAVLEGTGFEDILRDEVDGETMDRPSGAYTVYRRPPEGRKT